MKAAAFDYARAESVPHALELLARHGDGARLLAGGQSLVPALNLRLLAPEILIDISHIGDLRGVQDHDGTLRIGALTRHADLLSSDLVAARHPLLREAVRHVAHAAIRNRGTIGGNLAHADPASELPACMLALDATIVVEGRSGERRIPAEAFFTGIYETALQPGEILTAVEIPAAPAGRTSGFLELARRNGDYALAGLACSAVLSDAGELRQVRLAYFSVGDRPMLAKSAAAALEGGAPSLEAVARARAALSQDLDPPDDLQATGAMRLHLAGVLLHRVLAGMVPGLRSRQGRAA
ncbi:FAD binding domain-containing protein [Alsobacter sp. SYSU BS001988]|jgi:carbon-monoxide dehydrogenase medium subunit